MHKSLMLQEKPLITITLLLPREHLLALDAVTGLGPEKGYTQSVCNPHHAVLAREAWRKFLDRRDL